MAKIPIIVNGERVQVDESFANLSPEQQEATVNEIAASIGPKDDSGLMGQFNQGVASGIGGLADFLNPFDTPHALNPLSGGTGSAVSGLENAMDATGIIGRATSEPDTFMENVFSGGGKAASVAVPAGIVARGLSTASGLLGRVAGDASKGLNTGRGFLSELFAGGGAQASEGLAEDAGLPEWAQTTAGLFGGVGLGAIPAVTRVTPTAIGARRLGSAVQTAMMPYTRSGGQEVARQRMQGLAGGPDRALELSRQVGPTKIGLTPAQQTGDPNLIGLEQEAMRRNPALRAELDARAGNAQQTASDAVQGMGGDPANAQSFINQRRTQFRENLAAMVDRATNGALRPSASRDGMANSQDVADNIRAAQTQATTEERALWEAVPSSVRIGTDNAKATAQELISATPRAQRGDVPRVIRELLSSESDAPFGDFESVSELHGLYSELRRAARSAMAGNDQNPNMARIANNVADAVLDDLGVGARLSDVGDTIDAARIFSAEKHDMFSRGEVGRLLRQSLDGAQRVDPRLTLEGSAGRGGPAGAVGVRDIRRAVGDNNNSDSQIEDFLRAQFDKAAFNSSGEYAPRAAQNFMRNNSDMMQDFPQLSKVFDESIRTQTRAANATGRAATAIKNVDTPARSISSAFTQAPAETAIDSIFRATRPSTAARQLVATARKDTTGEAFEGVRGAFSSYLIRNSTDANGLNGKTLSDLVSRPEIRATLSTALSPADIKRVETIASELTKLRSGRRAAPDVGGLSPRSPNRIIEMAARIVAARQGAKAGGGGASIQTAQMASGRMKAVLGSLQNDKAEQMLMDAMTDPDLFRLLLTDTASVKLNTEQVNRLAPYFTGAVAATSSDEGTADTETRR
jgi:hypothetical protein